MYYIYTPVYYILLYFIFTIFTTSLFHFNPLILCLLLLMFPPSPEHSNNLFLKYTNKQYQHNGEQANQIIKHNMEIIIYIININQFICYPSPPAHIGQHLSLLHSHQKLIYLCGGCGCVCGIQRVISHI